MVFGTAVIPLPWIPKVQQGFSQYQSANVSYPIETTEDEYGKLCDDGLKVQVTLAKNFANTNFIHKYFNEDINVLRSLCIGGVLCCRKHQ